MTPKLSVIIASYNHQDYIAETLESLEKQTFQDFEIILVDDGSTDKTVEIAGSFPSRAQIFTQENRGVVAARNRGLSLAKGEYICFVDSDDVVLPNRFTKQVAALDGDPEMGLEMLQHLAQTLDHGSIGMFHELIPEGFSFLQSWSGATFVRGVVEDLMGIHVRADLHAVTLAPQLAAEWDSAELENLRFAFDYELQPGKYYVDVTIDVKPDVGKTRKIFKISR